MGTDWLVFLKEARRCLKVGGVYHIVEVESRFEDVDMVVRNIEALGFRKVLFNPGSFFLELRFAKIESKKQGVKDAGGRGGKKNKKGAQTGQAAASPMQAGSGLSACIYRRR
eukprot:TRINITY_DN15058_c0_g1_i1.p2 TRINITY_DN15058_c0_g1~~TRINITY_DN15058_c0_g1_i1.p2  ORF type:complete len:112 (-),score=27.20 TRINITY_DN15058_c0_g1_i1:20-355(-)